jgi:peptide deformylase
MPKISDQVVQGNSPEEFDCSTLNHSVFPVNMRLFNVSPFYRQIIMDCIQYMESHLNMHFDDYHNHRGISGAELGLPWNIIAYKHGQVKKYCINPKIINVSKDGVETETKCGALKLDKAVKVFRHSFIDLEYYDLKGGHIVERNIGRTEGGFTIQHEIDHNNGISILDREIK